MSLTKLEEGRVATAAVSVVAVAWDGDPLNVCTVVATKPNQTELEEADELNWRRGVGRSGPGSPWRGCAGSSLNMSSWPVNVLNLLELQGGAYWPEPDCSLAIFLESAVEQSGGGQGGEVVFF